MVNYSNQPEEIGWSAIHLGRLLIWLRIVRERYSEFAEYVDKAVLRWNFCDVIDEEGALYGGIKVEGRLLKFQEGRLGYEEYAAKGFQLWGFKTEKASKIEPYKTVKIYGIEIPYDARDPRKTGTMNPLVSLPFLLYGMEFQWEEGSEDHAPFPMKEIAERIYKVQEARYLKEGIFTARTDHQLKGPPYFVYDTIFALGYPWNTIADDGTYMKEKALVATKAAFGIWALWKTPYSDKLIKVVSSLYDLDRGWYEGRNELTGKYEEAITCSTNALVLESLLYKVKGKLFRDKGIRGYYERFLKDPFKGAERCLPAS